jgi:hypothetical protein
VIGIALTLASLALVADAAKSKAVKVKGRLDGANPSHWSVLAVGADGRSTTAAVSAGGRFTLSLAKSEARDTTLHLIDRSDGRYAGPVVLAKGATAATRLAGKSGNLGTIAVRSGFAVARGRAKKLFGRADTVGFDASTGTPGAGRLGLVARPPEARAPAADDGGGAGGDEPGDDSDADGIPNQIDVDDDGDTVLDAADPDTPSGGPGVQAAIFTDYFISIAKALNANAGGVTQEAIDALLAAELHLVLLAPGAGGATNADVQCTGLPWCTTATVFGPSWVSDLPFGAPWSSYDSNGNGIPNLRTDPTDIPQIVIKPNVTTADVHPGDTLLFTITTAAGETITLPAVLPFYFTTTPLLASVADGTTTTPVTYPVGPSGPGTEANPFALTSGRLTMTLWRPQRPAIPGAESGTLMDMGGLSYGVSLGSFGSSDVVVCDPADYSDPSPTLEPATPSAAAFDVAVLHDTAPDAAPDPTRTLAFTVDLAACLARAGHATSGKVMVDLTARDRAQDNVALQFHVQLP